MKIHKKLSLKHSTVPLQQLIKMSYSNSNRQDNKSPNPKLARYLHRIQQLVGNRNRTPSPLSSRISKPLKTNSLDHYLKYQLTFKILTNLSDRKNKHCLRYFFNLLRSQPSTHSPKIEKIFKFVPIEKTSCAHMIVDSGISVRMLGNVLRALVRERVRSGFQGLRAVRMGDSGLGGFTARSGRSGRSSVMPLSVVEGGGWRRGGRVGVVLVRLFVTRLAYGFNRIKQAQKQSRIEPHSFQTPNRSLHPQPHILSHTKQQTYTYSQYKIKINKIQTPTLKPNYLHILLTKLATKTVGPAFRQLALNWAKKQLEDELREEEADERARDRVRELGRAVWIGRKREIVGGMGWVGRFWGWRRENGGRVEESVSEDVEKVSAMVSTSTHNRTTSGLVYDVTNKINITLVSIILRRKVQFFRVLEKKCSQKCTQLTNLSTLLNKKLLIHKALAFQTLKLSRSSSPSSSPCRPWQALGHLINISKYFRHQLREPFNAIRDCWINRKFVEENLGVLERCSGKFQVFRAFGKIREQARVNRAKSSMVETKKEEREGEKGKKEALPRLISKYILLKQIDFFIKLKLHKKSNFKPPNPHSLSNSRPYNEWHSQIQSFITQRERFNRSILENYKKLEIMINQGSNIDREEFGEREGEGDRSMENLKKEYYGDRKLVFSPKSKSTIFNK